MWVQALALSLSVLLLGCTPPALWTFADLPGFTHYYGNRCQDPSPFHLTVQDQRLLDRFRPRVVVAPGSHWPIDFYRDYLPHTVLRDADRRGKILSRRVTRKTLREAEKWGSHLYLDLIRVPDLRREGKKPTVYGRVYHEEVSFRDGRNPKRVRHWTFLKYNVVFAQSGLPVGLPRVYDWALRLVGLSPEDWHELDNFCAAHIVLDENQNPIAVLLAQHNHHRTYLVGRDLFLPKDGRMVFCAAKRSNELYPDRGEAHPVFHRTIPSPLYLDYLLSGENGPWLTAKDLTYGLKAGGEEVDYKLGFLDPCDPFYTSRLMLGEYRPFWGFNLWRNGPPGADYYTLPPLLPLGNLLQASYFHEGDQEDLRVLRQALNPKGGLYDFQRLIRHGGQKLYRHLRAWEERNPL